jgi:hypothetical protein
MTLLPVRRGRETALLAAPTVSLALKRCKKVAAYCAVREKFFPGVVKSAVACWLLQAGAVLA